MAKHFFKSEELTILESILRTSILYFILLLSAKVMGFRQVGITTPYNFLMAAGVSHIAASRMTNPESRPVDAIVIIIFYTLLNLLISYLYLKYPRIVSQKPVLLIEDGKFVQSNLSKTKYNIHNILSSLRLKDAFSIKNVSYAFAEPVGEISVAINPQHLPPTKKNLNITVNNKILPEVIIYQAKVDYKVLKKNSLDYSWLVTQLNAQNVKSVKDVLLAIIDSDKTLYVCNLKEIV